MMMLRICILQDPNVIKVYEIRGPLFFGSVGMFLEHFDCHTDPELIEIHFNQADIFDLSAIQVCSRKLSTIPSRTHSLTLLSLLRNYLIRQSIPLGRGTEYSRNFSVALHS